MSTTELNFTRERATKNCIRYQEQPADGQQPVVGTLYLQKHFAGAAEKVRVTIETDVE